MTYVGRVVKRKKVNWLRKTICLHVGEFCLGDHYSLEPDLIFPQGAYKLDIISARSFLLVN